MSQLSEDWNWKVVFVGNEEQWKPVFEKAYADYGWSATYTPMTRQWSLMQGIEVPAGMTDDETCAKVREAVVEVVEALLEDVAPYLRGSFRNMLETGDYEVWSCWESRVPKNIAGPADQGDA